MGLLIAHGTNRIWASVFGISRGVRLFSRNSAQLWEKALTLQYLNIEASCSWLFNHSRILMRFDQWLTSAVKRPLSRFRLLFDQSWLFTTRGRTYHRSAEGWAVLQWWGISRQAPITAALQWKRNPIVLSVHHDVWGYESGRCFGVLLRVGISLLKLFAGFRCG